MNYSYSTSLANGGSTSELTERRMSRWRNTFKDTPACSSTNCPNKRLPPREFPALLTAGVQMCDHLVRLAADLVGGEFGAQHAAFLYGGASRAPPLPDLASAN
jgi:hypothetical protein